MTRARRTSPSVRPAATRVGSADVRLRPAIIAGLSVSIVVVVGLALTPPGAFAIGDCHRFLEYYSGVFSLVALSLTVMAGIAATDRLILLIKHRILLQAVHRATAFAAVAFLGIHITMKVVEGHVRIVDVVIPFLAPYRATFIGLGTIAAYLIVVAAWTGIVRARFTVGDRPWLWRLLHSCAYACWPVAILHGLKSGRPAAGWVTASYAVCLILVGLGLLIRLSVTWGRRLRTPKASTTSTIPRIPGSASGFAPARSETVQPTTAPAPSRLVRYPPITPPNNVVRYPPAAPAPPDPTHRSAPASVPAPTPLAATGTERRPAAVRPAGIPSAPPPSRALRDATDEEFWDFMRGDDN
jgi:hypothetical protein